tara:strand:+ start:2117 stop:2371 length:255 start_codon:yes stop_codon:yes gene_type:complete
MKNVIPLLEEDIENFNKINFEFEELAIRLGNLGMRKMEIEQNEYQLSNIYADLSLKQQAIVQGYIKKYGDGGVDLSNKVFIINQ